MPELPSLKGRWLNVGLCCGCWDTLNPDRKLEPERRAGIETSIALNSVGLDKDDIYVNRCTVCEDTVEAGIYVRATIELVREWRKKVLGA